MAAMQLPDIPWSSLNRRARQEALTAIAVAYSIKTCGGERILKEEEAFYRYQADLAGLDWESAPAPRTSTLNKLLKGGALAASLPLMFVSPGLTTNVLDRIDKRLSNDDVPALQPVKDEEKVIERVRYAQELAMRLMLDRGLISEIEYEDLKAKVISQF
jgi:hypothetical protein